MTVIADWTARRAQRSRARHLRPTNPAAGVARRRVALCGSVWLCVALRGSEWRCVALCGSVWRCVPRVALCGAVWRRVRRLRGDAVRRQSLTPFS